MDLGKKYLSIAVNDYTGETITVYARRPTNDERIDWKVKTQQMKVTKGRNLKNEGIQNRVPLGKGIVIGIKAPVNKNGEFVNGFAIDGKPIFANPETGECSPQDWKEIIVAERPDIIEQVACAIFDGATATADSDDADPN